MFPRWHADASRQQFARPATTASRSRRKHPSLPSHTAGASRTRDLLSRSQALSSTELQRYPAGPAGLEPAAFRSTGGCSGHLSYGPTPGRCARRGRAFPALLHVRHDPTSTRQEQNRLSFRESRSPSRRRHAPAGRRRATDVAPDHHFSISSGRACASVAAGPRGCRSPHPAAWRRWGDRWVRSPRGCEWSALRTPSLEPAYASGPAHPAPVSSINIQPRRRIRRRCASVLRHRHAFGEAEARGQAPA
jgi:hypothetical protein